VHRILFSTGNIVVSLLLGAIALAVVGINFPETLDKIINVAGTVKGYLVNTNLAAKYNVWVRLLLEEKQLVFMFFTVLARVLMSIVTWFLVLLFGRSTEGR
jgi:hypothetical protein